MLQSTLFSKTKKEIPRDEKALNAILLTKAGFIKKLSAGIYLFSPLGERVRAKVKNIIREELNKIGAQEVFLSALSPVSLWEKTGRLSSMEEVFYKFPDHSGKNFILSPTHEEIITFLAKDFIYSYKDLPKAVYQIQTKFRDEKRAQAGLLRTKEFTMKDLYSFHRNSEDLEKYYEKIKKVYFKIFKRVGLKVIITEASGGYFSKYSHEFMALSEVGEDRVYTCSNCGYALNREIADENIEKGICPKCGQKKLEMFNSIEVGNIFKLGDKFSKDLELKYKDEKGKEKNVIMGCYGLGIERIIGTVVEINNDKDGIIWPEEIAPYKIHLISLGQGKILEISRKIYENLTKKGLEVLFDDRKESAAFKLKDADLIGLPYRLVISEKTLKAKKVEFKKRNSKKVKYLSQKEIMRMIF